MPSSNHNEASPRVVRFLLHFHTLLLQRSCFVLHGRVLAFVAILSLEKIQKMNFELERERLRIPTEVDELGALCGEVDQMLDAPKRCVDVSGGANSDFRFGNGCNLSRCTTPAETNHMAGSAREPVGHSMCTSNTWMHRDSMDPALATSCVCKIRWDARRPLDSTTSHGDTF